MGALLKVVDEHFGTGTPERLPALELRLASQRICPREIIQRRVEAEVEAVNQRKIAHAVGHARTRSFLIDIENSSPEAVLNRPINSRRKARLIDVGEEIERATTAFYNRQFIMLLDDRQIDDLDDDVTVMPESEVVFLFITPLKGG